MAPYLQDVVPDVLHANTATSLATSFPNKILSPLVTDADQFEGNEAYIYQLSLDEIEEVKRGLHSFQALGLDGADICPDNFPLPSLGPRLKKLAREVHSGLGFVVLRGLDPCGMTPEDNAIMFIGVSSYIGELRGKQTDDGKMFSHVRSAKEMQTSQKARPIKDSNRYADFHNDMYCDIIAMQTISNAEKGGAQLIASVPKIYNELMKTRPDVVELLKAPDWPLDLRRRFAPTETRAMLFHHAGRLVSSIIPDALVGFNDVQRTKGLQSLTDAQQEALGIVQRLASQYRISLPTNRGDMLFLNNFAFLHTREAFEDSEQNRRYLMRMWLKNRNLAWELPPALEHGNHFIFHDDQLAPDWNILPVERQNFHTYERYAP